MDIAGNSLASQQRKPLGVLLEIRVVGDDLVPRVYAVKSLGIVVTRAVVRCRLRRVETVKACLDTPTVLIRGGVRR